MSKTRAYGSDVQLLGVFEDAYGVAVDGSEGEVFTRLFFQESSLGAEQQLNYESVLGQGRDAQDPYYEGVIDEGDFGVPFDLRALGFWLKGLLGSPETVALKDSGFCHTFLSGKSLPSLSFEIGYTALKTPKFYKHNGTKLGHISFDMSQNGSVSSTIGVIAQGESLGVATVDASPKSYLMKRFHQSQGVIKVNDSPLANVTGGKFTFSNNLERVETIRNDGLIDGVDETESTADGSIDVRFSTDNTLIDAITSKTPLSMEYTYIIPGEEGYALTWHMPRVFLPKKKQEIKGPGGIQATYDWRAAYDSESGYMLKVTLTNDVSAY